MSNKLEGKGKQLKTKTQVSVGKTTLVDPSTGELKEFTLIEKNITKDFNFHKIWLQDVLNVLDTFGNKKILVITYLLKNMRNEDNTISGSYREIAKKCNVSYPLVAAVMKELISSDIIRKYSTATYQFNPSLIIKGSSDKRRDLLIRYNYIEDENLQIENAKTVDLEDAKIIDITEPNVTEINPNQKNLFDAIKEAEK